MRSIAVSIVASAFAAISLVSAAAAAPPATDPELAQFGRELEQGYAKLEDALRQAPRESFDPQAVIEQVGRDPAKLAAWVRENTDLLPYRGALRGPRGVMMDRGGNSLDRSLLLAELIASAGFEVRLANATLPPEQATALAAAALAPTRAHHPQSRSTGTAKPDTTKFRERVGRHANDLLAALGKAPASTGATTFGTALADHWWVQRGDGNGAWADVDPCNVAPLPAPARTITFKARDGMLPLDSKDCHEVTLRLVVEAFLDGKLTTQPVLQQTIRPIEVIDQPLRLTHYADAEPINEGLFFEGGEKAAAEIRRAMIEQKLFLPVLYLGTNALTDASFDTAGRVDKNPKLDNAGKMAGGLSSAMGGAFGGLTGGGAKKDADVLTAEWIEYEIRVPGEQPQTIRRMVFDLIGPVARAAGVTQPPKFSETDKIRRTLALTGVTQIALQPCDMPAEFVMDHFSRGEIKDRAAWMKLSHNQSATIKEVTDALRDTVGGPDFARLVAMARWKLGPTAAGVFIDRPNVIHYRIWATEVDKGGTTMREGIDLAFTSTASLDPKDRAFAARVTQGVADTLAEHLGADARVQKDWAENTIRVFEIAAEKKLAAPVVVRNAADLDPLGLEPDVRARAASDVAAGNVLVLAKLDTGRSGWWRVDAKTGQTVGVMDNGYHATTVEYKTSNRPPAGPARAQYLKKMMKDRFKDLDTKDYMDLIGEDTLYMDEWEMVLQLQGKAGRKALSLTQEILLGRLRGF